MQAAELFRAEFTVERKVVEVSAHENEGGRFVRIVERVGTRDSAIIIPMAGVAALREALGRAESTVGRSVTGGHATWA